ncbi:Alcohol dehydrogenase, putative [Wickerhamomyces ciferrii]|uniref:Alcohol dehydrogenase, putative n=1 Tax=Wickerhamomyces ciferrii (strain ATCC 14091 / BCRC 22168 / CBS 111 / JCM 3599 / NBRC 0793 / NRRL Y-1031 F-60-10) TaxID=1206466 RepID=K0KPD6_WICCF|nr:Alcohol dehydrogenase, putative [Wickerhamomyces ciferrii]CCH47130.1 Alcohol dehydrogenase, putative [Wickerhamomyces ciferrii]
MTEVTPIHKESSSIKCLALQWMGKDNVEVNEVPKPQITEPEDALIKVTGSTVCGSDLHLYHGEILDLRKGDILGHEYCGIVEEIGSNVKDLKPGDRIVASFQIACGHCRYCKQKLTSGCDNTSDSPIQKEMYGDNFAGIYGYAHFTGGFAGGQAEYVRAPKADFNLMKIPDNVPDEKALYISDIIPTSYHSVVSAEVKSGDIVAIWGLGPIGILAANFAKLKGAKQIIGIDNVKERLDKVQKVVPGTKVINFDEQKDVVSAIREIAPGGVDASIDAAAFRYAKSFTDKIQRTLGLETDTSELINEQIKATKKFGTISLVADYVGLANQFLIGALMEKGITLRGCGQAPVQKYWKELMSRIQSGEFDPSFILTHRFDFKEFKELYKAFDEKKGGIEKVFVQTKFSKPPAPGTPKLTKVSDLK